MDAMMRDAGTHPDFYEPAESYKPSKALFDRVSQMLPRMWRLKQDHFWTYALAPRPGLPVQGWKIHVSTLPRAAVRTLETVVPICLRRGVEFKFASDYAILGKLLSKTCSRGSAGKFITIYPPTEAVFHDMLEELAEALKGEDGPYILSDRRYKDCRVLYYRYGGFQSLGGLDGDNGRQSFILDRDYNLIKDARNAFFTPPAHVKDRYEVAEDASEAVQDKGPEGFCGGKYAVRSVIRFSNAGGVYVAEETGTRTRVILKETRPHVEIDDDGIDVVGRLRKEHRILTRLSGTGLAPEPLDLFEEWEHCFLAQELVKGDTLRSHVARTSRVIRSSSTEAELDAWFEGVRTLAVGVVRLMEGLHAHGIIFGDLSLNNVMVDPETLAVRLIDFEGAHEPGVDQTPVNFYTPGFARKARMERACVELGDDLYALGCVLASLLMPTTLLVNLRPDALESNLEELRRDFGIPAAFIEVIRGLLSDAPPPLAWCLEVLSGPGMKRVPATPEPAADFRAGDKPGRILDFTHQAMDLQRRDRLFPSGPGLSHPLTLDHGALGVACAWQRIRGEVPGEVTAWILANLRFGGCPPGLYNGMSGIASALLELGHAEPARRCLREAGMHRNLYQKASLGSGLAGYGLTHLRFWRETQEEGFLMEAVQAAEILCETRTETERGAFWEGPEDESGAGVGLFEGSSGVALFLLYMHCVTEDPAYLAVGEAALRHDLSHGRLLDGALGFPEFARARHKTLYPYLSHGSAGVGTALVRYHALTKRAEYLEAIEQIKGAVAQKYTIFPGLFNGLAGLGHYLLDAEAFMGDPGYRDLARRAAQGLKAFEVPREAGLAFPGDGLMKLNTDYATGSAGIALFLDRLDRGGPNALFLPDELLRERPGVRVPAAGELAPAEA